MPKFNKKIEIEEIDPVACVGSIEIMSSVRKTKTGSGYLMIGLRAQPAEGTPGISVRRNLMFHPDWLSEDFDPAEFSVDPISVARAKARIKRATENDEEPAESDTDIIKRNSQSFVYQLNIYGSQRPSLLQSLLGERFDDFADAVDNATPEEFLSILQDAFKIAREDCIFIYECSQNTNQEGEKTNQMEVSALYRVENAGDVEAWLVSARARGIEPLFDPKSLISE